jgi:hypothetical protein
MNFIRRLFGLPEKLSLEQQEKQLANGPDGQSRWYKSPDLKEYVVFEKSIITAVDKLHQAIINDGLEPEHFEIYKKELPFILLGSGDFQAGETVYRADNSEFIRENWNK